MISGTVSLPRIFAINRLRCSVLRSYPFKCRPTAFASSRCHCLQTAPRPPASRPPSRTRQTAPANHKIIQFFSHEYPASPLLSELPMPALAPTNTCQSKFILQEPQMIFHTIARQICSFRHHRNCHRRIVLYHLSQGLSNCVRTLL